VIDWGAMLYERNFVTAAIKRAEKGNRGRSHRSAQRSVASSNVDTIVASVKKRACRHLPRSAAHVRFARARWPSYLNEKAFLQLERPPVRVNGFRYAVSV